MGAQNQSHAKAKLKKRKKTQKNLHRNGGQRSAFLGTRRSIFSGLSDALCTHHRCLITAAESRIYGIQPIF